MIRQLVKFREEELEKMNDISEKRAESHAAAAKAASEKVQAEVAALKNTLRDKMAELQVMNG